MATLRQAVFGPSIDPLYRLAFLLLDGAGLRVNEPALIRVEHARVTGQRASVFASLTLSGDKWGPSNVPLHELIAFGRRPAVLLLPALRRAVRGQAAEHRLVPWSRKKLRGHFERHLVAAKLDEHGYTLRQIRTTFAHELVAAGCSIMQLQRWMRHRDPADTLVYYLLPA